MRTLCSEHNRSAGATGGRRGEVVDVRREKISVEWLEQDSPCDLNLASRTWWITYTRQSRDRYVRLRSVPGSDTMLPEATMHPRPCPRCCCCKKRRRIAATRSFWPMVPAPQEQHLTQAPGQRLRRAGRAISAPPACHHMPAVETTFYPQRKQCVGVAASSTFGASPSQHIPLSATVRFA